MRGPHKRPADVALTLLSRNELCITGDAGDAMHFGRGQPVQLAEAPAGGAVMLLSRSVHKHRTTDKMGCHDYRSLECRRIAGSGSVRAHVHRRTGGGRKGDLSRFIEEAVRAYLFERAVSQAKAATAEMNDTELTELIDEAVQWARER